MTGTLETRDRLAPGAASSSLVEWHYSPALESTDHFKLARRYNLFIGGEFVEPHSKRWFETINPATEETLAEIAEGDAEDVDRAVRAARRAYRTGHSGSHGHADCSPGPGQRRPPGGAHRYAYGASGGG